MSELREKNNHRNMSPFSAGHGTNTPTASTDDIVRDGKLVYETIDKDETRNVRGVVLAPVLAIAIIM